MCANSADKSSYLKLKKKILYNDPKMMNAIKQFCVNNLDCSLLQTVYSWFNRYDEHWNSFENLVEMPIFGLTSRVRQLSYCLSIYLPN